MRTQDLVEKIRRVIGLDRAILFTLLARGWSGVVTIVLIGLISKFLSPAEQGYYYSFASLVAVQSVFELGFSFVILQMASHERAHLSIVDDHLVVGEAAPHARLASVIQKAVRWYAFAAILMTITLIPIGIHFFVSHPSSGTAIAWRLPWYCVVLAATLTFQLDPIFSFLEGCGYVPHVARTRFWQALVGGALAWGALMTHHGLYAPALLIFGKAIGGCSLLWARRKLLFKLLTHKIGGHQINWGAEVWPFQWRVAVCWISGYFTFELFSPILFAFHGPVAAGQMGMSLSICNGLNTLAYAWLSTKAAPIGMMVARKEYEKLDSIFFRALTQSVGIILLGSGIVWTAVFYANVRHMHFAQRLLAPGTLVLLLGSMVANTIWFAEALYLRAHKQEKFMWLQVSSAAFIALSSWLFGRRYGAFGMSAGYLVVNVLIGVGFGTYIFMKYRRLWHTPTPFALEIG